MSTPDYDKISRYVDGEMNAEELKAFEEELQQDAELQKATAFYREVNDTLKYKLQTDEGESALRTTLEKMKDQYFSKEALSEKTKAKVVPFRPVRRWIAAAAMILVIIIAGILFWAPWKKDLYKQYAYIEMSPVTERGLPADSLLKLAAENFNNKKFAATIPLFESLLKLDPQNTYVHYYYAIALLESSQVEKSRTELAGLYEGNSLFKYDAAFYMALSYLRESVPSGKEKDKDKCKEWLNKIPADAGPYNKAQELLNKL